MSGWLDRNRAMLFTGFWVLACAGIYKAGEPSVAATIVSVWAIWLADELDKRRANGEVRS